MIRGVQAVRDVRGVGSRGSRSARRSTNVVWEAHGDQPRSMREQRNGHQAAVLWFTGLSGSGKSTVARLLERRLFALGCQTFYLDGDNVRHGLNGDLGFSDRDRKENIRRVAEVAKLAFEHGDLVLCTFISPVPGRSRLRPLACCPTGRFFEVYVKCDLEVCQAPRSQGAVRQGAARRDQGVHRRLLALRGAGGAELVIETDLVSAEDAVEADSG